MPGNNPQDLRPYFEATHPTPKPTAEPKLFPIQVAFIRCQAFDEAVDIAEKDGAWSTANAIRALARETKAEMPLPEGTVEDE